MNHFRTLRADEIECRVASISNKGLTLLLYKDARCDQNILDETVGPFNWMRHHSRENANCTVSIWDAEKAQWIEKEDVGTPSNTEAAKGLASDSFKRACFNWGVGRELYSAPFIWVPAEKANISTEGGKAKCYDRFTVQEIEYQADGARDICSLTIWNEKKKCVAFRWAAETRKPVQEETEAPAQPFMTVKHSNIAQQEELNRNIWLRCYAKQAGIDIADVGKQIAALQKGGAVSERSWKEMTADEFDLLAEALTKTFGENDG